MSKKKNKQGGRKNVVRAAAPPSAGVPTAAQERRDRENTQSKDLKNQGPWFYGINTIWRLIVASWRLIVASTVVLAVLTSLPALRQEISVDPSNLDDASDPFSQRFVIVNNGLFSIQSVHYTCSVTSIRTTLPDLDRDLGKFIQVMIPFTTDVRKLDSKEKTSTDCDFIMKFGAELQAANIAINVFYKRWPWPRELRTSAFKFSAQRRPSGRFVWDPGSPDESPFDSPLDENGSKPALFIPFIGSSLASKPPTSWKDVAKITLEEAKIASSFGHKVKLTTVLPANIYLHATPMP